MKPTLSDFEVYLLSIKVPIRLACISPTGPIAISLWYQYADGKIYCSTQQSARVAKYLAVNPQCGFEIAADTQPYCGIRGQAVASLDQGLGVSILKQTSQRYLGGLDNPLAEKLLASGDTEIAIVLDPVSIFSWDFSDRMIGRIFPAMEKIYP